MTAESSALERLARRGKSMLDHIGMTVSDVTRSRDFYLKALQPLGMAIQMEVTPEMSGSSYQGFAFGRQGKPDFWIGGPGAAHSGLHVAFTAGTRAEVDGFYKAAIAAGGRDNGAPGIRAHYHPIIMARSCSTRMGITSRRSAIGGNRACHSHPSLDALHPCRHPSESWDPYGVGARSDGPQPALG